MEQAIILLWIQIFLAFAKNWWILQISISTSKRDLVSHAEIYISSVEKVSNLKHAHYFLFYFEIASRNFFWTGVLYKINLFVLCKNCFINQSKIFSMRTTIKAVKRKFRVKNKLKVKNTLCMILSSKKKKKMSLI